jgi:oxygen-independent coproporphyrinogen III oxidase
MFYNPQMDTRSLYLHWPFCPYKCHFCPFVALASHDQFMERYHKALVSEIEQFGAMYKGTREIDTIFLGGGTPSTYPDELLLDTFATLKKIFLFSKNIEVSIEVNPGTVRTEQLALWKQLGINRLSIGVQSLKDTVLQNLNRLQSTKQVQELLAKAPEYYDSISVDLILGLPGVSEDEWKALIEKVVTWPIKHVSVYFLTVHEDTPLYFKVTTNRVTLPTDETMVTLYEWTVETLAAHDFERYELSNFAKPGYESRHNTVYWERKPYKAFGLGACSFDGKQRFQNEKNLLKYMEGVEHKKGVTVFWERLTSQQIQLERLMLGLRRKVGVSWTDLFEHMAEDKKEQFKKAVGVLKEKLLLEETDGQLLLTTSGMVVENEIIAHLSN